MYAIRNGTRRPDISTSKQNVQDFSSKFKIPIIFLVTLLAVTGLLLALYFALKKDIFSCDNSKKDEEEQEDEPEVNQHSCKYEKLHENDKILDEEEILERFFAEEDDQLFLDESNKEQGQKDIVNNGSGIAALELQAISEEELLDHENNEEEIIITKSSFVPEKTKNSSSLKSVFKKIKRPTMKVKFGSGKSTSSTEDYPLCKKNDNYAHLTVSGMADSRMSVVSENIEEFGDEVSLGRLQTSLRYDEEKWTVIVGAKQGDGFIYKGREKIYWQVHIAILPHKRSRFRTKFKPTRTPVFKQYFEVEEIPKAALPQIGVRFRVYGRAGKTGVRKLAGEFELSLDCLQESYDEEIIDWHHLKRRKRGLLPII
eukprot:Seg959.2 transcript_id=Seg959.2/GoldUCD/mRNA.D3Y31 product=Synaptotagmin-14 protein_id=Seg959.2/GoldUCD/D3Y31